MEENKNNAIEKTENLANKPQVKKSKTTNKKKKKPAKKPTENKREKIREQRAEEKHKKMLLKKRAKEEKKKALLEKRENVKNIKLQKQAENKRQKEAKLAIKREKLAEKRAKRQALHEERMHKRALRSQERREKRNRGVGGWLAAVISLGCAVLILGSLLTLNVFTPLDNYMMTNTAEERSFYDLVGTVDNLDVNLSKLVVSKDSEKQQKLLSEVRVQSNLATSSLGMLALHDESKYNTAKFINQVGDFAKYLENKLIDGESLSKEDKETLNLMHKINLELKNNLSELASTIDKDFNFKSIYEGKDDNLLISKFNELESNATNYPHMIYDGAFSDNVKKSESKYLNGLESVTKMQAEENFKNYFKDYKIKDVELVGETISDKIECYDFEGKSEDGTILTAEISKKGGKLILFNHYKDCSKKVYSVEELEKVADKFLENAGYKGLKAVWVAEGNNYASFNYASVIDGVICYSDLIKVNVCTERGIVSGIEASAYALNHVSRDIPKVEISLEEAMDKVYGEIEVESSRLAIIPYGSKEKLAYEFYGNSNGDNYYIYIDTKTGKELEIFKVIKTTEGTLLM